jgi:hypothetical protein
MPVSQDTGIFLMRYIQGENRSQSALFPLSLDELIPDDHLVRVIEAYISLLDFEQLGFDKARPKATGRPSYDPADLLKLYMYGYFQRIRSSRGLRLSVSATSRSCGCWADWRLTSKPLLIFAATTVLRLPRPAEPLFDFADRRV